MPRHLRPLPHALFVFTNKRRNRIKLLYFDGTGLWLATKRLEKGRFSWPAPSEPGQRRIKFHAEALQLLIGRRGSARSRLQVMV